MSTQALKAIEELFDTEIRFEAARQRHDTVSTLRDLKARLVERVEFECVEVDPLTFPGRKAARDIISSMDEEDVPF